MVFLTSMATVFLATNMGKGGVVYAFIIALCMEVFNLLLMTKSAKKAEDLSKGRYKKVFEGYKQREGEYQAGAASLKRSNEALEKQLQEYIDKINGLEIQIRDKDKLIDSFKDTIEKQSKVIDAATKPAWE